MQEMMQDKKKEIPSQAREAMSNLLPSSSSRLVWLFGGFLAGMAAMFLFDPQNGPARRYSLRKQSGKLGREVQDYLQ